MTTEKKMADPYSTLGEAFESSVVAGNPGKITGNQIGLSERLRQYAYYRQENATETADALLVNDLLDAARRIERHNDSENWACKNPKNCNYSYCACWAPPS